MDCPTQMKGSEFEADSGDAVSFTEFSCSIVDDLYFNESMMELLDYNARIFDQSFWYREVAHK
jgi:hypothetical protein